MSILDTLEPFDTVARDSPLTRGDVLAIPCFDVGPPAILEVFRVVRINESEIQSGARKRKQQLLSSPRSDADARNTRVPGFAFHRTQKHTCHFLRCGETFLMRTKSCLRFITRLQVHGRKRSSYRRGRGVTPMMPTYSPSLRTRAEGTRRPEMEPSR